MADGIDNDPQESTGRNRRPVGPVVNTVLGAVLASLLAALVVAAVSIRWVSPQTGSASQLLVLADQPGVPLTPSPTWSVTTLVEPDSPAPSSTDLSTVEDRRPSADTNTSSPPSPNAPATATPATATPATSTPATATPATATPATATPATSTPATATPATATPATSTPATLAVPSSTSTPSPTSPKPPATPEERGQAALSTLTYPWAEQLPGWTITFTDRRDGLYGLTMVEQKRIEVYVRVEQSDRLLAHVIAHEIGHAVDVTLNDGPERRLWQDARNIASSPWWPGDGATDFRTGAGDFAESFAAWQVGTEDFRSELGGPPNAEQLNLLIALSSD